MEIEDVIKIALTDTYFNYESNEFYQTTYNYMYDPICNILFIKDNITVEVLYRLKRILNKKHKYLNNIIIGKPSL